jgi:hypothetical protein
MSAQTKSGRRVVAQISMTLDGRVTGPEGPADMEVIARYAVSDAATPDRPSCRGRRGCSPTR